MRTGRDLESSWCSAEIWKFPELMHRLAASSVPLGDGGDSAEVAFFVIEWELRVRGSLV